MYEINAKTINGSAESSVSLRQAVLVLGMHRSGTSALTRVLNLLGVDLGNNLMSPVPGNNVTGFWEHREIPLIHESIYERMGRDWTMGSRLPNDWWAKIDLEDIKNQLSDILQRDLGHAHLWGMKDPRLPAMLPLWKSLLPKLNCTGKCILIFRHPQEVARSLEIRDGICLASSYLLWLRSFVDSVRGSRKMPRTLTSYAGFLTDWKSQIERIGKQLDINWPRPPQEISAQVDTFLRPQMRHHRLDDSEFLNSGAESSLVRRAYSAILEAADTGDVDLLDELAEKTDQQLQQAPEIILGSLQQLELDHRASTIRARADKARFDQITERNAAAVAQLRMQNKTLTGERDAAQPAVEEVEQHLIRIQEDAADLRAKLAQLQTEADEIHQREHQARQAFDEKAMEASSLRRTMESREHELSQVAQAQAIAAEELRHYRLQRSILLGITDSLHKSRSWRWTAPLRAVVHRLHGSCVLNGQGLAPMTPMERLGPIHWLCDRPPQFVGWCLPVRGWIQIRLEIETTVASNASLYFDSGNFFNAQQRIALGPVNGVTRLDQLYYLTTPVYAFRLDPVEAPSEFRLNYFMIKRLYGKTRA